jgi:hypothetical protein
MNYDVYAKIESDVFIQRCLDESITKTIEILNDFFSVTKLNSNKNEILIYALFHPIICMVLSEKEQILIDAYIDACKLIYGEPISKRFQDYNQALLIDINSNQPKFIQTLSQKASESIFGEYNSDISIGRVALMQFHEVTLKSDIPFFKKLKVV